MDSIAYHLQELAAARDPADPRHCLPRLLPHERDVLDIGCGIGQLFVASGRAGRDRGAAADSAGNPAAGDAGTMDTTAGHSVGIDIDQAALAHGAARFPGVRLLRANAGTLPFADASFDVVVSRVSLPYTDMPRALGEIARVLRPGGRLWLTLHPVARTRGELRRALALRQPRDVVFRLYVLLNGWLLHATGRSVAFPGNGRHESFQTPKGMRRLLAARGFESIEADRARHFLVTARRPA